MSFDAYHKWLGIPPEKQPPHHYQLLGISVNETDCEVIETAAQRQRAAIEENLHGPHRKAANQLMFEIDEAELTLLTPELREEYDQQVKRVVRKQKRNQSGHNLDPDSNQPAGEGSGLLVRFAGIISVIVVGYLIMSYFEYQKPRTEEEKKALRSQQISQKMQPAVPEKPTVTFNSSETTPASIPIATTRTEAFEWVFSVGGSVRLNNDGRTRIRRMADFPSEPYQIFEVDLLSCDIKDEELPNLIPLAEMESIIANITPLTDKCIPTINQLTNLQLLHIPSTKITGAGIARLSPKLKLTSIFTGSLNLQDDSAKDLVRYPVLETLSVSSNPMTGKSLAEFTQIKNIVNLQIHMTEMDDTSLALLREFPAMKRLWVGNPLNSEKALMDGIQPLSQLSDLHIYSVPITDLGTSALASMNNLEQIGLNSTNISDANLARLKQALPNTKISVNK
ncbi:MAG: hypothetical protein CME33_09340 [Gimesia sp.]|uniref:hypothetical protein n=1 Tax=Gimesia sp. TaxID=2024833 RepID=UPI000C3FDA3A|nr:hypothetical protein [Gimesia sp.]MAX36753.1 hypothetical protein [Gimesia sp.]|tara:strand:+ start:14777 stop:16129 length:1353 start_codon:yes stop_codon:yes gene_type:complete